MDDFRRVGNSRCSVGGYKCHCCGPKPGKEKHQLRRYVRRQLRALARKTADTAMVEEI